MYLDLALAGLINYEPNVRLNIITDQDQNNQTVPEVPEHANDPEITEPVENHVEEEHDQTVPEIQAPEPAQNSQSTENKKKPKKRKTKKKNFGNKPKKRNQRDYRKFPAIRVPQQPQEDENISYIPLDDMHSEPEPYLVH